MRPNQQNNRRSRGRNNNQNNNNNRRSPNPLTRSYESNGPDVKIRGNAQTVAEKYLTLARDAQSAGDRVIAENYFQHAEHYNRIIATAQAQQAEQQARREQEQNDDNQSDDDQSDDTSDASDASDARSDDNDGDNNRAETPRTPKPRAERKKPAAAKREEMTNLEDAPQPEIVGEPAEVNFSEESAAQKKAERPRRTRRPRKVADADISTAEEAGGTAAKPEAASEEEIA